MGWRRSRRRHRILISKIGNNLPASIFLPLPNREIFSGDDLALVGALIGKGNLPIAGGVSDVAGLGDINLYRLPLKDDVFIPMAGKPLAHGIFAGGNGRAAGEIECVIGKK